MADHTYPADADTAQADIAHTGVCELLELGPSGIEASADIAVVPCEALKESCYKSLLVIDIGSLAALLIAAAVGVEIEDLPAAGTLESIL